MKSLIAKRGVVVAGHKTTVSLELEFWNGLREIAGERDTTLSGLVTAIDSERQDGINLSSAIRVGPRAACLPLPGFSIPEREGQQLAACCHLPQTTYQKLGCRLLDDYTKCSPGSRDGQFTSSHRCSENITRVHNGSDVAAARIQVRASPAWRYR